MAVTTAAVIGAGAAVAGTVSSRKSAKEAAKAQSESAEAGLGLTQQQFEDVKTQLLPFIESGAPALGLQSALSGASGADAQRQAFANFEEDPGTDFLRNEGLRLIESTPGLSGGNRLKELTRFSQGLALQDLNNRFNRLGAVSGTGLNAAVGLGGVSGTSSAAQANLTNRIGSANALGTLGVQQATSQGIEQIVGQLPGLVSAFQPQQGV